MAALWFFIGALSVVAALFVVLPWLRSIPTIGPLPKFSWTLSAGAAALLAIGVGMYVWLGRPDVAANTGAAGTTVRAAAVGSNAAASNAGAGSMSSAIVSLQARLAKGSGSADDWELLAKAYEFVGRPDAAAQARAHQLPSAAKPAMAAGSDTASIALATPASPSSRPAAPALTSESLKLLAQADGERRHKHLKEALAVYTKLAGADQLNADGWADYADTAASLQGNRLAGEPEHYIARALALDPQHPKALWLQASADEESGRLTQAVATWRELQGVLAPDSPDAKIVAANLQQDLKLVGGAGTAPQAQSLAPLPNNSADAAPAGAGAVLQGQVSLNPALKSRLSGGETLFIVAKSVDSPGPPVAVMRGSAGAWPVTFRLDDSQAMIPGRNLSSASRVTVEARISRSGQALPMSGDLAGSTAAIDPKTHEPLAIVIDRVVP
jgi:cytochrome c-type biogenesis protein CcmH